MNEKIEVSILESNLYTTKASDGLLDTSRSKEFDLRSLHWRWHLTERPDKEVVHFEDFRSLITEETLSIGNISTRISLKFKWATLVTVTFPVTLRFFNKNGGGILYDLPWPEIHLECNHDQFYNSGLIKLELNHYDIISRVQPIFPDTFTTDSNPCDE